MPMTLGAHEVLELHEILSDSIHGLNTLRLFRPHAKDPQLQSMMDRHMNHSNTQIIQNIIKYQHFKIKHKIIL